jgi:flagellar M-ring protein FliF
VVLVDASGRFSLGPKTADALRLSSEQALEQKLISTLEAVTGPGNVRASVTIDYDPDALEETSESYDPAQSATLSMERTEQTSGGQPVAAGVPGTASNAPNSQALPVYPKQTSASQSSKSESGTYGVSKTVRHKVETPGKVRRLTAAVVVNDRETALATRGHAAQWQARSADELRNLTLLAQAAVGSDAARGDIVTVQGIPFEQNRSELALSLSGQLLSSVQMWPEAIKYFSLLLGLMIVMTFGVRPALRQAMSGLKSKGGLPAVGSGGEQPVTPLLMEPVVADASRMRAQQMFDKVSSQMREEPTQSSRLLQSWIHSD